jgi:hypothetical protein
MKLDDLKTKWKTLDKHLPEGKIVDRQALKDLIRQVADEEADRESLLEPGVEEHSGDGELLRDCG